MPPIGIDELIESPTVGRVIRSNNAAFQEGDILYGFTNWEDYMVMSGETLLLERLQPEADVPLSYYVGALGGSGTTAYVGLHDIGEIQHGRDGGRQRGRRRGRQRRRADRTPARLQASSASSARPRRRS